MVCGQIHAPATLPNHIHMHLKNSIFLATLQSSRPRLFLCPATHAMPCLAFPSTETRRLAVRRRPTSYEFVCLKHIGI